MSERAKKGAATVRSLRDQIFGAPRSSADRFREKAAKTKARAERRNKAAAKRWAAIAKFLRKVAKRAALATKYAVSGQWADDFSKGVHWVGRGIAGKFATKKSQSPKTEPKPTPPPKPQKKEATYPPGYDASANGRKREKEAVRKWLRNEEEVIRGDRTPPQARPDSDALDRLRQLREAKAHATVRQHDRAGTAGVSAHSRRLTPNQQRQAIAQELLK